LRHSTLSRRARTLPVPLRRRFGTGRLHLLVDSTGVKLGGAGEWLVEKHGTSRRRSWRKLHVSIADRAQCRGRKLVWSMERHADVIADWARCRRGQ
jgi:hypothetical protein